MTESEKAFFDRKLKATKDDPEAFTNVLAAVITRCLKETKAKMKGEKEKQERNEYYKSTNFGL